MTGGDAEIRLPGPETTGRSSVEEALAARRSVREYARESLTLVEVSQLLWAAQGITQAPRRVEFHTSGTPAERGFRTAPSAGARYPLELRIAAGRVEDLPPGIYRYSPHGHALLRTAEGDARAGLSEAALGQSCVRSAPAVFAFSAVNERMSARYRERGIQYVYIEVGHAAQNLFLQAVSLGLGTVPVGAFRDDAVKRVLGLPDGEEPLYLMPVGKM